MLRRERRRRNRCPTISHPNRILSSFVRFFLSLCRFERACVTGRKMDEKLNEWKAWNMSWRNEARSAPESFLMSRFTRLLERFSAIACVSLSFIIACARALRVRARATDKGVAFLSVLSKLKPSKIIRVERECALNGFLRCALVSFAGRVPCLEFVAFAHLLEDAQSAVYMTSLLKVLL